MQINPSDIRSMCCRLRLDLRQLNRNVTGGLFGSGDSTGSVGVVSINMPRIGYLSRTKEEFFERLEYLMNGREKYEWWPSSLYQKISWNLEKSLFHYWPLRYERGLFESFWEGDRL